ncbi:MAG TPA: zf-HC2 domain-containing protein [Gemmatimonadales bacterium]|jgi:anti-sigma factor RsiW|nr:zf-HC2 domain-containing protein [Gemmatimonadales bacterium]
MLDRYRGQLSAYLDGELAASRRRRLEAHLVECIECAALLADLRAIVAAAPHYEGRAPARDLWKDIEAKLDEPEVLPLRTDLPTYRPTVLPSYRRFSWRQLTAASIVMAAVGGGATWLALRTQSPTVLPSYRPTVLPSEKTAAYAEAQYDAAVRDLERELAAGRSRLDTATVRTIEQSLAKIDAAIAEARLAIQQDPANAYLNRQIAANMRRKLNLLRVATNAIAART